MSVLTFKRGEDAMLHKIKRMKGNSFVQVALVLVVLLGIAALAIDGGMIFTARNQLQSAVDAAALAGASGLIVSEERSIERAITFAGANTCINEPVTVNATDVTFPAEDQVRVGAAHTINLYFARIFGIQTADITATATAALEGLAGTGDIKPWAIPDLDYVLGEPVILKTGTLGAPGTEPSFFYPVDFPPANRGRPIRGARQYGQNIIDGSDGPIFIGDELQVEPGNMVGPTANGVNELIAMDPTAYWDGDEVAGSVYPDFTSPRICKIPFFDVDQTPNPGRNSVIVIRLGAFFLEGVQQRDVYGRFIEITTGGFWGGGSSDLLGVRLVE
jgi:hypothetical protein